MSSESLEAKVDWRKLPRNRPHSEPIPRIMARVVIDGECWVWTGRPIRNGYGRVMTPAGVQLIHRVMYEHHRGPIPEGRHIDHLCRVKLCVNPDHLEAVTPWENVRRGTGPSATNVRKTHCIRGHEFTPENTGPGRKPWHRACRACARERYHRGKVANAVS